MLTKLTQYLLDEGIRGSYRGIQICDLTMKRERTEEFVKLVTEALQLIEFYDSRRFRTIQRELRYIANAPLISAAQYYRNTHSCRIDFAHYPNHSGFPEREWYVASCAATIVHEATHGRLYTFGIPYNRRTWLRCERLCHIEEKRFVSRLRSENYDMPQLVPDFAPNRWKSNCGIRRWIKIIKAFRHIPQSGRRQEK